MAHGKAAPLHHIPEALCRAAPWHRLQVGHRLVYRITETGDSSELEGNVFL